MPNSYQAGAGAGAGVDTPITALMPRDLYITADDQLRVTAFNALTGVVLTIRGRLRGCDGVTRPFVETLTPTTDRVATTKIVRLSEGWLSNVLVVASSAAPLTGQTFVRVALVHGEGTPALEVAALAAGYVTAQQPIAWPGSLILNSLDGGGAVRSIVGTTPAAGAEVSETVPTGARWELLAFHLRFAASAAVANRFPQLVFDDGANIFFAACSESAVAANGIVIEHYSQGISARFTDALSDAYYAIPNANRLGSGFRIRTVTTGIQGADQYNQVQYLVREFIEGA